MTTPEKDRGVSDAELLTVVESRLRSWDFDAHPDSENVNLAYELGESVINAYSRGLGHIHTKEFPGEELPEPLKPLYTSLWCPYDFRRKEYILHTVVPDNMMIKMSKRGDRTRGPIEGSSELFEIMSSSETFGAALRRIEAEPELIAQIRSGKVVLDKAVIIKVGKSYERNGLEFIVEEDKIDLYVFGNEGETHTLCEFMFKNRNKQTLLAQTAARLATLGAKYFNNSWPSPSSDLRYSSFDPGLREID